jgi:hypothetical protein
LTALTIASGLPSPPSVDRSQTSTRRMEVQPPLIAVIPDEGFQAWPGRYPSSQSACAGSEAALKGPSLARLMAGRPENGGRLWRSMPVTTLSSSRVGRQLT